MRNGGVSKSEPILVINEPDSSDQVQDKDRGHDLIANQVRIGIRGP